MPSTSPPMEGTKAAIEEGVLPPEPTLLSPPQLDHSKLLEHLRGLQSAMGALPTELAQKLQELEEKAGMETKLSHGQLNKMGKIQRQITNVTEKITKLDQDWQAFVTQVEERFCKHRSLFQQTRAELIATRKSKLTELAMIKEEISRASQSLLSATVEPEQDVLEVMDDQALLASLQQANQALETLEEYPDMEEDAEMIPEGKPVIQAFQRRVSAASPTKVAKDHLKVKENAKGQKPEIKTGWRISVVMLCPLQRPFP